MDESPDGDRAVQIEAARRALLRKPDDLMNEDGAYVPWHYRSDLEVHHPDVRGFVHDLDSIIRYEEPSLESRGIFSALPDATHRPAAN